MGFHLDRLVPLWRTFRSFGRQTLGQDEPANEDLQHRLEVATHHGIWMSVYVLSRPGRRELISPLIRYASPFGF